MKSSKSHSRTGTKLARPFRRPERVGPILIGSDSICLDGPLTDKHFGNGQLQLLSGRMGSARRIGRNFFQLFSSGSIANLSCSARRFMNNWNKLLLTDNYSGYVHEFH
jgi:hypothetical protein